MTELQKFLCEKYNLTRNDFFIKKNQTFINFLFHYFKPFLDNTSSEVKVIIFHCHNYNINNKGRTLTHSFQDPKLSNNHVPELMSFLEDLITRPEIYTYFLKEQQGLVNMYTNKLNDALHLDIHNAKLIYYLNNRFPLSAKKQIVGFLEREIEGHIEDNNETIFAKIICPIDSTPEYHFIKNTLISRANYLSIKHLKLKQLVNLAEVQLKEVQDEQFDPMLNILGPEIVNSFGRVLSLNTYLYYYHSNYINKKNTINFIDCINNYIAYITKEFNILYDCIQDNPKALKYINKFYGEERFQEFHQDLASDIAILSDKVENFITRLNYLTDGRVNIIPDSLENYCVYLEGRVAHYIKTFNNIEEKRGQNKLQNHEAYSSSNEDLHNEKVECSSNLKDSEGILDKNIILPCLATEELEQMTDPYDSNIVKQDNLGL